MVLAHGGHAVQKPATSDRQAPIRSGLRIEECLSGEADATAIAITAGHERHGLAHERGG